MGIKRVDFASSAVVVDSASTCASPTSLNPSPTLNRRGAALRHLTTTLTARVAKQLSRRKSAALSSSCDGSTALAARGQPGSITSTPYRLQQGIAKRGVPPRVRVIAHRRSAVRRVAVTFLVAIAVVFFAESNDIVNHCDALQRAQPSQLGAATNKKVQPCYSAHTTFLATEDVPPPPASPTRPRYHFDRASNKYRSAGQPRTIDDRPFPSFRQNSVYHGDAGSP
jgi:hypothetical protein